MKKSDVRSRSPIMGVNFSNIIPLYDNDSNNNFQVPPATNCINQNP